MWNPVEVTARLRPYRLIHQIQELGDLDSQLVDVLIAEAAAIVPLLVGVLRGWAQDYLPADDECSVENALAILGEIGDPAVIPHLLEFLVVDNVDLSGAAGWAFDRIVERNPEAADRELREIASVISLAQRIGLIERLVRFPNLDPKSETLALLGENLSGASKEDLDNFLPLLVAAMMLKGRAGSELARAALRRNKSLLSRRARGECEELIQSLDGAPAMAPPVSEPTEWTVYDICGGETSWDADDAEDDGDGKDLGPPQIVHKHHTPGRNDPCWCGSGKKYKKCHLDSDQRSPADPAPVPRGEFDRLRNRIGAFLSEVAPLSKSKAAFEEFFQGAEPAEGEDHVLLIDWMIHDWILPRIGRTVLEEFLRRHGSSLTPHERETVQSWSRSFAALYEVREVRRGTGLKLKDLTSGEILFVHDINLSNRMVLWDGLLARVVNGERGLEFGGVGLSVPRQQLDPLLDWMKEDRQSSLPWPDYLKRNVPRIRRALDQIGEEWRDSIQLTNTDREELMFSKAVYRILDEAALIASLKSRDEIVEDEDGERYAWLDGSREKSGATVLGSIRLEGGNATIECNSKARLKRGKKLLNEIAGGALQHLRDEFTTQREARRAIAQPDRAEPEAEVPREVSHRIIGEYLEQHYSNWPDMELPALDGKTPREAVKTAAGRRKVSALLRDFENGELHKRDAGEPYYEMQRLRTELGLD